MAFSFKKISKDIWVIVFLATIFIYTSFNLKHWNKEGGIIAWDVVSYYGYLPATFIYGDVSLEKPNEKFDEYEHVFWLENIGSGKHVFKMSMGMSILYAPFFFVSHVYSIAIGEDTSGFSPPYKFGLAMSSLFYLIIGFIFLRKLLRIFFSEKTVAYTLLFVGLGTNLYYYTVIAVGMPHVYLFNLLTLSIYLTLKWLEKPTYKISLFLGILAGLMVLIRPTMLTFLLFPLLFNVFSLQDTKKRMLFFYQYKTHVLTIFFIAVLVWIPQLIYWKIATGDYLFYSYSEEGFFFSDPQIFNTLFSFRKGWLLYTPLMIFSFVGFVLMLIKRDKKVLALVVPILVYLYITSSWWCWWFGGSFGNRTMIDMFPLLTFGLAYFLQLLFSVKSFFKVLLLGVMFLLLGFNLFQTRQAHEGLIHHDSMTKAVYFKILFKLQKQISRKEVEPFLDPPNYDAAKKGRRD